MRTVWGLGAAILACVACTAPGAPEPIGVKTQSLVSDNGIAFNGLGTNGISINGISLNGLALNGIPIELGKLNGLSITDITLNARSLGGIVLNGISLDGIDLSSLSFGGMSLDGIALDQISLDDVTVDGQPLGSAQAPDVETALEYLAECALDSGQCVDVTTLAGGTLSLCGVEGNDPGWASAEPDLTQAEVMGECVVDRATTDGRTVSHAPLDIEAFKQILAYMVSCALPATSTITISDENNQPLTLGGALGLAPEWEDGALSDAGQRWVSSCLASRANAVGRTVQLSIRGQSIAVTPLEVRQYARHEGAFAANLFADTPYIHACQVKGGGISGRTCTDGETCGFDYLGPCYANCATRDAAGNYVDCQGQSETLNTYLAFSDALAFGIVHTCLRYPNGKVYCVGYNARGQLGNGDTSNQVTYPPTEVLDLDDVAGLASGGDHTCAHGSDGAMRCWGRNDLGQVGDGTTSDALTPVLVSTDIGGNSFGSNVAQAGVAWLDTTCAVETDGSVWCWGRNDLGQVGDGSSIDRANPSQVVDSAGQPMRGFVEVVLGNVHTCGLRNDGTVWCWGQNKQGNLGQGTFDQQALPHPNPLQVTGLTGVTDIAAAEHTTCALSDDGATQTVYCWGQRQSGIVQNTTETCASNKPCSTTPLVQQGAPSPMISLTMGRGHACVLADDRTAWCWGENINGELGDGTLVDSTAPVQVVLESAPSTPLDNIDEVLSGGRTTFARLLDGTIWAWGRNGHGEVGDNATLGTRMPAAVQVSYYPCGDGTCDTAGGEDCEICSADCDVCPDPPPFVGPDAGPGTDPNDPNNPDGDGGCGCRAGSSGSGGSSVLWLIVAAVWMRRRRRRSRSCSRP